MILLSIDFFDAANIVLIVLFLFLAFKLLEIKWSYKISKPYQWERAVKNGIISKSLIQSERYYRDKVRFYTFWLQIERLKKENIEGAFLELGVYKGETAKIIHQMDTNRKFFLLDTFEGFDQKDLQLESNTDKKYTTKKFSDTNIDQVIEFINGNNTIQCIAGYFPDSIKNLPEQQYAFVHLDADLYQPTLVALNYFYPRLSPKGVIVIHDYNHTWPGVTKAVKEFMDTIPETLTEIADWQGSAMIVKNSSML